MLGYAAKVKEGGREEVGWSRWCRRRGGGGGSGEEEGRKPRRREELAMMDEGEYQFDWGHI